MAVSGKPSVLHSPQDNPYEEVLILADIVGKSKTTLAEVVREFLAIVSDPIIAGGFAMAHHGFVRATTDIDVLAVESVNKFIEEFKSRGYKHESIQLPIGSLELLTKGNKGVDFIGLNDSAFLKSIEKRAVSGEFFGTPVRFVSLEDLIVLKSLAILGRSKKQDEADLEVLLKMSYDLAYVSTWKKKFKI